MTTTDLSQFDQNVRIQDRLWNLHSTAPDVGIPLEGRQVFMLVLEREFMGGSARAFDMIDRTESQSGLRLALLQFMLRAVELVVDEHAKSVKENRDRLPYPFAGIFLETVVESHAVALSHAKEAKTANVRANIVRSFYGKDVDDMAHRAVSGAAGNAYAFLSDCRDRAVVEYRLFIVVDRHVNFAKKLESVMKLANDEYVKRTSSTTLSADNKALREYKKATGNDASASDFSIAEILRPDEHWALINSPNAMLDAIAVYTNNREFLNAHTRQRALSAVNTLGEQQNPAYLGGIFSAMMQFLICNPRIDDKQRTWGAYVVPVDPNSNASKKVFSFPYPNRVLVVPIDRHNRRTCVFYVPDYQLRSVDCRIMHQHFVNAQRAIADAPPLTDEDDARGDMNHLAGQGGDFRPQSRRAARAAPQPQQPLPPSRKLAPEDAISAENRRLIEEELVRADIHTRLTRTVEEPAERNAIDQMVLKSTYVDPRVHNQRKQIALAQSGNFTRTTLDQMASEYSSIIKARLTEASTMKERCIVYSQLQLTATRDYIAACTNPLADVSQRGRVINQFFSDITLVHRNSLDTVKFFDDKMSVFAHMMIREMMVLDVVYHTYSTHMLQLVMQAALFDAYRREHDLHMHVIVPGPPEAGKSNALETLERRAISGTVDVQSRHTAKAHSIDESRNDICEGMHEGPARWLIDPHESRVTSLASRHPQNHNNSDKESTEHEMFKNKLTEMVLRTLENVRTPDGRFVARQRISEQIMTYIIAVNLYEMSLAEAIVSRMYLARILEVVRRDATLADKTINQQNESLSLRARREREDVQFRILQTLFYNVEKLFYFRAMTPPTLTVLSILMPIFARVMEEHGVRVKIRALIKLRIYVRHLVIRRAFFMLYQAPKAPFAGVHVDIAHLLWIDPWLYDDQEIVFFAFRFMASQYVDPHVTIVAKALRTYLKKRCGAPRAFERYREGAPAPTHNARARPTSRARVPKANQADVSDYVPNSEAFERAKKLADTTWATADADDTTFDFNRVFIREHYATLVTMLETAIAQTEKVRLSKSQIEQCLIKMTQQTIYDHPRKPNPAFGGEIGAVGDAAAFPVLRDIAQPKESSVALKVDAARSIVSLHVSVIDLLNTDPIDAVIKACCDANTPANKMLSGDCHEADLPHLFGVHYPEAHPGIYHYVPERTKLTPTMDTLLGIDGTASVDDIVINPEKDDEFYRPPLGGTLLEMPIDEYSTRQRMDAIHLPQAAWSSFSFHHIEQQIRDEAATTFVKPALRLVYPAVSRVVTAVPDNFAEMREAIASYSREDAKLFLQGRVSYLMSTTKTELETKEVKSLLESLGYNVKASEKLVKNWDAQRRATEAKLLERQAKDRADQNMAASAIRARIDKILNEKRKRLATAAPETASAVPEVPRPSTSPVHDAMAEDVAADNNDDDESSDF